MVGQHDRAAGGGDHGRLDGGFRLIRRGQATLDREPVGAEEGHVHEDIGQALQRPGVHGGKGAAPYPAPHHQQADVRPRREDRGHWEGVGHHRQFPVDRHQFGQPDRGAAGVEQDGALRGQFGQGGLGYPLLLGAVGCLADRQARLGRQPLDRDRAPVHAAEHAAPFQGGQVAADGFGGDVELLGEFGHVDPARDPGPVGDERQSLLGVHVVPLPV